MRKPFVWGFSAVFTVGLLAWAGRSVYVARQEAQLSPEEKDLRQLERLGDPRKKEYDPTATSQTLERLAGSRPDEAEAYALEKAKSEFNNARWTVTTTLATLATDEKDDEAWKALTTLLDDGDGFVRKKAVEAIMQSALPEARKTEVLSAAAQRPKLGVTERILVYGYLLEQSALRAKHGWSAEKMAEDLRQRAKTTAFPDEAKLVEVFLRQHRLDSAPAAEKKKSPAPKRQRR